MVHEPLGKAQGVGLAARRAPRFGESVMRTYREPRNTSATPPPNQIASCRRGLVNHAVQGWWARMRDKGWRDHATPEQRAALKRDLEPIITIYNEL